MSPELAGMSANLRDKVIEARAYLDGGMDVFTPSHMFAMFSGGHDSLCATHLASQHYAFSGAAHMNTTIGIEETRQFVRDTCRDYQWPLKEYHPPTAYRDIVLKHGFPGPGGHLFMYTRLKERSVRALVRDHKTGPRDRILLITGVRLSESKRRMGHVEPFKREGTRVWVAPILNWTDDDKAEYMTHYGLRRNPVVDRLCMSGECLCGAFAKPEELAELTALYPQAAETIKRLQDEAEAAGVHAKWGKRPPGKRALQQRSGGALCWSCDAKVEDPSSGTQDGASPQPTTEAKDND